MRMTRKRVVAGGASGAGQVDRYAAAFARVRLVRAWIAAAAAMVAMLYAYVALLERVVK
jgi:phage shock protein PspC (stress-responsive transcriptional regulator)